MSMEESLKQLIELNERVDRQLWALRGFHAFLCSHLDVSKIDLWLN